MGVDTTFLCFRKFLYKKNFFLKNMGIILFFLVEDSETNNGTMEKPFYMSDQLKKILGKENKF